MMYSVRLRASISQTFATSDPILKFSQGIVICPTATVQPAKHFGLLGGVRIDSVRVVHGKHKSMLAQVLHDANIELLRLAIPHPSHSLFHALAPKSFGDGIVVAHLSIPKKEPYRDRAGISVNQLKHSMLLTLRFPG